ncbi:MAG: hypothetical protein AAFX87_20945 [Bacteroidota bacterium]
MKSKLGSFFSVLLAGTLFLFTSCESEESENVNQDRIYALYELFYDANRDVTFARTTFFFGNVTGTKLELSDGASITFDGQALAFNNTLAFYEREIAGFVDSGSFSYTDLDGNTFNNPASINTVDFPDGQNTVVNKSQSYTIEWDGTALSNGESVTVSIVPNAVAESELFIQASTGATSIILTQNRLEDIQSVVGELVMDRFTSSEPAEATSAGGEVLGHYRASNLSVTIE